MLSLSKAYGGAEEKLQPYASLQIAAIQFLKQGNLSALKSWMARHLPLGMRLIDGGFSTYLEFAAAYEAELDMHTKRFLIDASEDESPATSMAALTSRAALGLWRRYLGY